jgi:DNA polymerase delta subunit 1
MLETGFQIDSLHRAQSFTTYESHVLFALRFMIDCSITGGNWVELVPGAYKLLAPDDSRKQSHCQLEAHVNYKDIVTHPAEGESVPEWPRRRTEPRFGQPM